MSLGWAAPTDTQPCTVLDCKDFCGSTALGMLESVGINRQIDGQDITTGLQLSRAEVLRGLRNFLNKDRPEHQSVDLLKEKGEEKGSGRQSTL